MLLRLTNFIRTNGLKAEGLIFYLLLFSIPFQARKILFQWGWGFNEWKSFSLYFTDILILGLFAFWVASLNLKSKILNFKEIKFQKTDYFLLLFLGIALLSVTQSSDIKLSLFSCLRLAEFIVLYFYIKSRALKLFAISYSLLAILVGGVFQSLIAIIQFIKQSSIGLQILGESVIEPNMEGVAVFYNSIGHKVMRAYGTTPHPNILAAYLLLALFSIYFLFLKKTFHSYWLLAIGYWLVLFAFFTTFSRTVIFIWVLALLVICSLIWKYWWPEYRQRLWQIFLATAFTAVIFVVAFWPAVIARVKISGGEEAVRFRVFYNKEALRSGSGALNINWLGVGTGNFVNWLMKYDNKLPRYMYQPVHNIYLLLYSETGVLGIGTFALFILTLIKNFVKKYKPISLEGAFMLSAAFSILAVGFFDHFFWTLQQGRLMLWLALAVLTL